MFSVKRDAHKNNYTCVSNRMLRDERLSLEAKGFMAVVLSLPDDWEFSVRGMVALCGVSTKAMYRVLAELQKCGYLKLVQEKSNNRFLPVRYVFREICEDVAQPSSTDVLDDAFPLPQIELSEKEETEDFPLPHFELSGNEESGIPLSENELSEVLLSENETQSNTNIPSIEKIINTVLINQSERTDGEKEFFEFGKGGISAESGQGIIDVEYRENGAPAEAPFTEEKPYESEKPKRYTFDQVCVQINAQRLAVVYERTKVHRIAYLIADCINGGARKINGELIPAETVRETFLSIRGEDVGAAIDSVGRREVKNFDAYFITTLYNTVTDRLSQPKPITSDVIKETMEAIMEKYRRYAEENK